MKMRAYNRGPQAYLLTLPLTLPQGRAGQRAGRGQGLGTPPPPLPSGRRRGQVLTAPYQLQAAPMAGHPVGCPPLWRRWGKTTTSPCRTSRRVQWRTGGNRGLPQGCHRAATGGQQVETGQGSGQGAGRQGWGPEGLPRRQRQWGVLLRTPTDGSAPWGDGNPTPQVARDPAGQGRAGLGSGLRWRVEGARGAAQGAVEEGVWQRPPTDGSVLRGAG